jgi:branched-chain amino acid transport system permease protein
MKPGPTPDIRRFWPLALLAVLAALPLLAGEYYVNLGSQVLIAAVFAAGLNLLVGYAGLTSLGHATYLGLSGYISALLALRLGLGHAVTAPAALILTTLVGAGFGWIALRASGLGFLMLTLALSQVVWGLGYHWVALSNGDNGLSGLTRPAPFGLSLDDSSAYYWFVLLVAAAALYAIARLVNSPFGAALRGTRDQPRRMASLGFNVWMVRWVAFVAASFMGAVAGLLYVYFHKFLHPSVMSITVSAEALLGVIAGGAGTLAGPVVGAALVLLLKNYASAYIERWNMLLGIVFVLIVIFLPSGIVPGLRALWQRRRGGKP